jgi:hypothetical protein
VSDEETTVEEDDVEATDAARNLAEENNVDLTSVQGTGSDGRITVEDVREAIDQLNAEETGDEEVEVDSGEVTSPGEPVIGSQVPTVPIIDESGSNIPPPNLVQPPAELPPAPSTTGSNDPALTDPVETAREAAEGTVNDASLRGDEDNEAQGDVEIATIPEGGTEDQEYWPPLTSEDWVKLGDDDELIPERLQGVYAVIVSAPRTMIPVGSEDDVFITVRTRDAYNATLTLPLSAVTLDKGGKGAARG